MTSTADSHEAMEAFRARRPGTYTGK
jgi:hypothetical protein